jgi:hypothetical protein
MTEAELIEAAKVTLLKQCGPGGLRFVTEQIEFWKVQQQKLKETAGMIGAPLISRCFQ